MIPFDILILSAGCSSRLGEPKQLVQYEGMPLLQRVIDACLETEAQNVYVALGAYYKEISQAIAFKTAKKLFHSEWRKGMGHTIKKSIEHIEKEGHVQNLIIVLTDQIHFERKYIDKLVNEYELGKNGIVISKFKGGQGPPVYFDKKYLKFLKKLTGDQGARALIKEHGKDVGSIYFDKGEVDIDTPDDLKHLN